MPPTGALDLENPDTRRRIAAATASVLDNRFNGVHLDFEPMGDADPDTSCC